MLLDNCTHESIKPRERSEASVNQKKSKGNPDKINDLILKRKTDLKEGLHSI